MRALLELKQGKIGQHHFTDLELLSTKVENPCDGIAVAKCG